MILNYLCAQMSHLQLHIEAMIFTATSPVKIAELRAALEKTFNIKTDVKAKTKKDNKANTEDSTVDSTKDTDDQEKVAEETVKDKEVSDKTEEAANEVKPQQEISEEQILDILKDIKKKYEDDTYAWELRKSGGGFQFLTKPLFYNTIANLLNLKTKRKLTRSAMETLAIVAYKQPVTKAELEHIRGVSCDYAIQKLLDKELVLVSGRADGPGKPLLYSTSTAFMDYFGINSPEDMPTLKEFQTADQEIGEPQE